MAAIERNHPKNSGWQIEAYDATITTTTVPGVFTGLFTFDRAYVAAPEVTGAVVGGTYGRVPRAFGADTMTTVGGTAFIRSDVTAALPDGTVTVRIEVHGRLV